MTTSVVDATEAQANMCLQSLAALREAMTGIERMMLNPDNTLTIGRATISRIERILADEPDPGNGMARIGVIVPFDPWERALGEGRN